jgi:pimeloyl-ACP methyl ester carboxylesterase
VIKFAKIASVTVAASLAAGLTVASVMTARAIVSQPGPMAPPSLSETGLTSSPSPDFSLDPVSSPSASLEKCKCGSRVVNDNDQPLEVVPGRRVVLLIHGINENPGDWKRSEDGINPLYKRLGEEPDTTVARFNYSDVSSPSLSPLWPFAAMRLAEALACLHEKSGLKVSIVAFSLGGLITQRALSHHDAAKDVVGLVAIGTPWRGGGVPYAKPIVDGLKPIPSSVPVMPVAGQILPPEPQPLDGKCEGGTRVPGTSECFGVIGPSAPGAPTCDLSPIALPAEGHYDGDGCFSSEEVLNPPIAGGGSDLDPYPLPCKQAIGNEVKSCRGLLHIPLKRSLDLVDPVVKKLNKWQGLLGVPAWKTGNACGPAAGGGSGQTGAMPGASSPRRDPQVAPPSRGTGNTQPSDTITPPPPSPPLTPPSPTPSPPRNPPAKVCDPPVDRPPSFHPDDCAYPGRGNDKLACPPGYYSNPENLRECLRDDIYYRRTPTVAFDQSSGSRRSEITGGGSGWEPGQVVTITSAVIAGGGSMVDPGVAGAFEFAFSVADDAAAGEATIVFSQGSASVTESFSVFVPLDQPPSVQPPTGPPAGPQPPAGQQPSGQPPVSQPPEGGSEEQAEQEQAEQEQAEQEQAEQEQAEQEQAEQEQAEQEQAEQEQAEQEQAEQEQAEQEQAEQEQAKQEQAKQEQAKQEQAKQEQAKQECVEEGLAYDADLQECIEQ